MGNEIINGQDLCVAGVVYRTLNVVRSISPSICYRNVSRSFALTRFPRCSGFHICNDLTCIPIVYTPGRSRQADLSTTETRKLMHQCVKAPFPSFQFAMNLVHDVRYVYALPAFRELQCQPQQIPGSCLARLD